MTAEIRLLRWPEQDRDDYERLVAAIERVRRAAARTRGEMAATVPAGPAEPSDVDRARTLLAQRRARDRAAGPLVEIFGEPSWDLLLAAFVAGEERQSLRLTEAAATAGIRASVAQRWFAVLAERGLIVRKDPDADPDMTLTPDGRTLVLRCISEV